MGRCVPPRTYNYRLWALYIYMAGMVAGSQGAEVGPCYYTRLKRLRYQEGTRSHKLTDLGAIYRVTPFYSEKLLISSADMPIDRVFIVRVGVLLLALFTMGQSFLRIVTRISDDVTLVLK